jgi:hypothetical protein
MTENSDNNKSRFEAVKDHLDEISHRSREAKRKAREPTPRPEEALDHLEVVERRLELARSAIRSGRVNMTLSEAAEEADDR